MNFHKAPGTLFLFVVCIYTIFQTGLIPDHSSPLFYNWEKIQEGEYWRLITPIFIHIGLLHLYFNMNALYQLGRPVEWQIGTKLFLAMVAIMAVVSNAAEYCLNTEWFGGISGVLFGLFGYIWIRNYLSKGLEFNWLTPAEIKFTLGFYLVCVFLLNKFVANYAHTAGLLSGMWFAFAVHKEKK